MPSGQLFGPAFRWTDPATWPPFLYVWLAVALAGLLSPVWKWVRRQRVNAWPTVLGEVQSVSFAEADRSFFKSKNAPPIVAEIRYSYRVGETVEGGTYERGFWTDGEAAEFIRDLKGKPVSVHYRPNNPTKSALSDDSIDTLLRTRAPKAELDDFSFAGANPGPDWLRPFLPGFVALSAIGLVLSLYVHLSAVSGRRVAHEEYFWGLHAGIFIVWFPAVFVAKERVGGVNRKDFWKVILKGSPDWVRFALYGLFAYAFVNFFLFGFLDSTRQAGSDATANLRGFSGHWMVFYGAALAILYSAAQSSAHGKRCLSGHIVAPNANFCSRCGQPVAQR